MIANRHTPKLEQQPKGRKIMTTKIAEENNVTSVEINRQITEVYVASGLDSDDALKHLICLALDICIIKGINEIVGDNGKGKYMRLLITDVDDAPDAKCDMH